VTDYADAWLSAFTPEGRARAQEQAIVEEYARLARDVGRRSIRLIIEGHDAQQRFWSSTAPLRCYSGGIGAGKTFAGAVEILCQPPGTVGIVVAPTYPMLRDGCFAVFLEVAQEFILRHNKSEMITVLVNGTVILWRSADDPNKLRGVNADWLWLDEAAYVDEEVWLVGLGRLRRSNAAGRAWVTTTPKGQQNWVFHRFVASGAGEAEIFQAKTRDNFALPESFLHLVEREYSGRFAAQELGGEFVSFDGGIFTLPEVLAAVTDVPPTGRGTKARFYDLATSQNTKADYTASLAGDITHDGPLVVHSGVRRRSPWPRNRNQIIALGNEEGVGRRIGIEAVGGWRTTVQDLEAEVSQRGLGLKIEGIGVVGDKLTRALPAAAAIASGQLRIYVPDGPGGRWWPAFLNEIVAFGADKKARKKTGGGQAKEAAGDHDDCVDALSGLDAMLRDGRRAARQKLLNRGRFFDGFMA
jgi:predicted phage terminase large subunit-like protein